MIEWDFFHSVWVTSVVDQSINSYCVVYMATSPPATPTHIRRVKMTTIWETRFGKQKK